MCAASGALRRHAAADNACHQQRHLINTLRLTCRSSMLGPCCLMRFRSLRLNLGLGFGGVTCGTVATTEACPAGLQDHF